MVQVVRWYMSAYHAGRKSSVAKKPYNPIIGEIFRCHWNIPEFGKFIGFFIIILLLIVFKLQNTKATEKMILQ